MRLTAYPLLPLLSSLSMLLACGGDDPPPAVKTGITAGTSGPGGVAGPGGAPVGTTSNGEEIIGGGDSEFIPSPSSQGPAPAGCGDGVLTDDEACDDGNRYDGDGCAGNCLAPERGFSCAIPGQLCLAIAVCGDGIVAGSEQCDDANIVAGDGCSAGCRVEIGSKCDGMPSVCTPTTCGDGLLEGAESCDDGNQQPFDGCSDLCITEPACTSGSGCTSECGDGLVIGEECDDGNTIPGDGCSATCTIEPGFMCDQVAPPCDMIGTECVLRVPAVFRDHTEAHPDFGPIAGECTRTVEDTGEVVPGNALSIGLVQPQLDAEGRPQLVGATGMQQCETGATPPSYTGITQFNDWFRDGPTVTTLVGEIILFDNGAGAFVNRFGNNGDGLTNERFVGFEDEEWDDQMTTHTCSWCLDGDCQDPCYGVETEYDGNPLFFPVDVLTGAATDMGEAKVPAEYGYSAWPWESDVFDTNVPPHNFYFTTEVQTWIEYTATTNATLEFTGDDDVWVFVNGILAVDLGGIHVPENGQVTISSATAPKFGLAEGGVYNITVFQAERRMEGSSFRLTLSGFENTPSECRALCGDGIVAFGEECDEGAMGNDGGYGECNADCRLGEFCGDGIVNGDEACDTGPMGLNGCINCRFLVAR